MSIYVRGLLLCSLLHGSVIAMLAQGGIQWIDTKADHATMSLIQQSLRDQHFAHVAKVAKLNNHLLVMTYKVNNLDPSANGNIWNFYDVQAPNGQQHLLLGNVYEPHFSFGLGPNREEIALSYYDCFACEPGTHLSIFHFKPESGWVTRWSSSHKDKDHPASYFSLMEYYEEDGPSDDAYAHALFQPFGNYTLLVWESSHYYHSRKITDRFYLESIDPALVGEVARRAMPDEIPKFVQMLCTTNSQGSLFFYAANKKDCDRMLAHAHTP